jgi:hypothetical protein
MRAGVICSPLAEAWRQGVVPELTVCAEYAARGHGKAGVGISSPLGECPTPRSSRSTSSADEKNGLLEGIG